MTGGSLDVKPLETAMVIDDEPFDQKMYRRIIERSGLVKRIISFQMADEALAYLRSPGAPKIDVIFLDVNMPRMNGFEFLASATRDLGPNFARLCVVMLTTSLDPADRHRAERFDIVREFINKPLTIEHIRHVAELVQYLPDRF